VEHFRSDSEVIAALSEAKRVLKVGGYLIVCIPNFVATFRNKLVISLTKGSAHKLSWMRVSLREIIAVGFPNEFIVYLALLTRGGGNG
jgi:ubiquinone/menaquinone biosynthesis C-methylase UbiE